MADPIECVELPAIAEGLALVVTDDEFCQNELVQDDSENYPAIPISQSDDEQYLSDGSAAFPFPLPNLQVQTGGSFTKMMIQDSSGTWFVYVPPTSCVNQRMLIVDGAFTFEDDVLPELLLADICEITACDEYDWLLGIKEVTIPCEPDDLTYFQLVKVPKTLCPTCEET